MAPHLSRLLDSFRLCVLSYRSSIMFYINTSRHQTTLPCFFSIKLLPGTGVVFLQQKSFDHSHLPSHQGRHQTEESESVNATINTYNLQYSLYIYIDSQLCLTLSNIYLIGRKYKKNDNDMDSQNICVIYIHRTLLQQRLVMFIFN